MAGAARTSTRDAGRVVERARTVAAIPALGAALDAGTVSGGHVDAVGRVLRQLEPCHRDALAASAGWLVGLAATLDPGGAAQGVDGRDGSAPRRRRDEPPGAAAASHPAGHVDRRRGDVVPAGPVRSRDRPHPARPAGQHRRRPVRRQDPRRLPLPPPRTPSVPAGPRPGRAHRGTRHPQRRPEIVAVLDLTDPQPDGTPTVDWGLPSSCPPRCCAACSTPPTSTRSSCAAASCSTPPAASTWAAPPGWPTGPNAAPCAPSTPPAPSPAATPATTCASSTTSSGGNTEAPPTSTTSCPLCVRHHHAVHDHGWHLVLAADRTLTITYPDGTTETTGPPRRRRRRPTPARPTTEQPAHDEPPALLRC